MFRGTCLLFLDVWASLSSAKLSLYLIREAKLSVYADHCFHMCRLSKFLFRDGHHCSLYRLLILGQLPYQYIITQQSKQTYITGYEYYHRTFLKYSVCSFYQQECGLPRERPGLESLLSYFIPLPHFNKTILQIPFASKRVKSFHLLVIFFANLIRLMCDPIAAALEYFKTSQWGTQWSNLRKEDDFWKLNQSVDLFWWVER